MKKLLTTLGAFVFLLALSPTSAFAYGSCTVGVYWNSPPTDNQMVNPLYPSTGPCIAPLSGMGPGDTLIVTGSTNNDGTYTVTSYDPTGGGYSGGSIAVDGGYPNGAVDNTGIGVTFEFAAPTPPPPERGLPAEIAAAEQGMASTTGFNIGQVITWSGDNLLKVFIGSGVGVIYGLRYWIVAMLIISLVVLFAFRGMRFFRH